jgi:hypothetical protein
MGGKPAERCKSEALFLTPKARSSAISIYTFPSFSACGAINTEPVIFCQRTLTENIEHVDQAALQIAMPAMLHSNG